MTEQHRSPRKRKESNPLLLGILALLLIILGVVLFFASRSPQDEVSNLSIKGGQVQTSTQTNDSQSQKDNTKDNSNVNWIQSEETVTFPILMYHAIHIMGDDEVANANLIVDPTTFESHLKALKDAGYYFLTPEEAYKVLTENVLPDGNKKIVWLTFDDSLWDFYTNAYPLLKKYEIAATNNVITGFVDQAGYLTLDQMKEMKETGISLEDHTVTHPDLSVQTIDEQSYQLSESDSYLDQNLNQDTIAVAYPAGSYSDDTVAIAEQYFKLGLTTNEGLASVNDGLLTLNRVRILPTTTADYLLDYISN
ncbi:polysaccharide deacetylase family protein [Streptococcus caprae]|uniref:Polysaccharide deacetylase family protein n=1 Tax=Streptococcus caprae TaxID=1640501 RepID=A0ABV8CTD0_9STRE